MAIKLSREGNLSQRARRRNRSTSREHLKPAGTQTGPLSKLLKAPAQAKRRREKRNNIVYSRESKQPLHKWLAQHRRANSSGQEPAVKEQNQSFEDNNANIFEGSETQSTHVSLTTLLGVWKPANSPPVRQNWRSLSDRSWNFLKKLKLSQVAYNTALRTGKK